MAADLLLGNLGIVELESDPFFWVGGELERPEVADNPVTTRFFKYYKSSDNI